MARRERRAYRPAASCSTESQTKRKRGPFDSGAAYPYARLCPKRMAASSPITRQTVGKTFIVASSVLGLAALAQVSAITWAFVTRLRETPPQAAAQLPVTTAPTARLRPLPPAPPPDEALAISDPFTESTASSLPANSTLSTSSGTGVRSAITPPAKPVPLTPGKVPSLVPQTRFEELIEQGRKLRDRGDMSGALVRLREAQGLDAKSALALAEIAITFEKMGLQEKAAEQWKRIYEMGETAGSYYIAADARLRQSQALAMMRAEQSGQPAPADAAVSTTNAGAVLGIGIVTMDEVTDENSERKFVLRVPLKARPRTRVEVRDVVIQVLFYDFVEGKDIVQTNANVNSRWASTPPDWSDGDTEVLEVEYQQPKSAAADGRHENRKYFGYIVRLYYKDDLQDSRAQPARLGAQFPAPTTLPKETSP